MEVRDAMRHRARRRVTHEFDHPPQLLPGWTVLGVELIVPGNAVPVRDESIAAWTQAVE
ncbi:hypothetical protein ACNQVK_29195 [Mycobacterium sp. 134]|uniref:hypothetical protein n=1 Tax=Mycobacterium sp. 134 TaxID=3400425 RepID=UPI003AABD197